MTADLVQCSCSNPDCNNIVEMPPEQKKKLFVDYFKRYGIIMLPYCCKECQEKHQAMLAEKPGVTPTKYKCHGGGLKL
ncbi:hypothetical protein [Methanococcoides sp. AM1]|uniref:hypothetical protein n=1 Tax=Methanococcoides sp. AM1 TaxID=1201011 RepID=UPI0010842160|nr:hypothetical protein [Methanococcoides sp. AM1]